MHGQVKSTGHVSVHWPQFAPLRVCPSGSSSKYSIQSAWRSRQVTTFIGAAALPRWAVQSYLHRQYVTAKPITHDGLISDTWTATSPTESDKPYAVEFLSLLKETTAAIPDVELIA